MRKPVHVVDEEHDKIAVVVDGGCVSIYEWSRIGGKTRLIISLDNWRAISVEVEKQISETQTA